MCQFRHLAVRVLYRPNNQDDNILARHSVLCDLQVVECGVQPCRIDRADVYGRGTNVEKDPGGANEPFDIVRPSLKVIEGLRCHVVS